MTFLGALDHKTPVGRLFVARFCQKHKIGIRQNLGPDYRSTGQTRPHPTRNVNYLSEPSELRITHEHVLAKTVVAERMGHSKSNEYLSKERGAPSDDKVLE